MILVLLGYVAALHVQDFGTAGVDGRAIVLLVGLWMPWTAWETSRKIRIPADETAYETYSKVLGWRVAPLLPLAAVILSAACLVPTLRAAGMGWGLPALLGWGARSSSRPACASGSRHPERPPASAPSSMSMGSSSTSAS